MLGARIKPNFKHKLGLGYHLSESVEGQRGKGEMMQCAELNETEKVGDAFKQTRVGIPLI